ncbi:Chromate resistance protein ChrB [Cupriavidus sp. 2SB]|uniref:Chromate resistance protein ChrB n=1 Tax=Cupriavidus sp. 2SB TaxID=2502199 RepID=UPI0010F746C7|nr:Chromate resistance protein ChrB [Cupriavidus sp. 2SB]
MTPVQSSSPWVLLIVSLPTSAATARMRFWRGIKALGAAALRDGVYLLPDLAGLHEPLRALSTDAIQEDGKVWTLSVHATAPEQDAEYRALFDRTAEYGTPVAEASGFEAILAGARERLSDDDALLEEVGYVLDSLYTHFSSARKR